MTDNKSLEVKKSTPIQELRTTMESDAMKTEIKKALPPHIKVDKFIRVAVTAASNDPKLLDANRLSFYNACMKAAADGLVPDGKEAALVIFGGVVSYMPMVAGILKKVRNSGELASITAQIVHKNDKFKYWIDGDGEHIEHEPQMFSDRGDKIGVYALAKTKEGAVFIEVMTLDQINAVRNVAKTKTVWDGAFGPEMWKKSAIRRLSKRLPMSTDLEQVIQRDDDLYDLQVERAESKETTSIAREPQKSSRLAKVMAENAAPKPKGATPPEEETQAAEIVETPAEPNENPNVDDIVPI